jgi:hypothetical protein
LVDESAAEEAISINFGQVRSWNAPEEKPKSIGRYGDISEVEMMRGERTSI